jgi:hypothetical protein
MKDLAAYGDVGNRLCWREFHSKKLVENRNSFLQTLATNPIYFYSLKSCVCHAPIEGVFIKCKRNSSWFRDCLGILVQLGEGKDLSFSDFALLLVLSPPSAIALWMCARAQLCSSSYERVLEHNLLMWLGSCARCMLEHMLLLNCTRVLIVV